MLANLLRLDLPPANGVALGAIRAELAAVQVGVAIRAPRTRFIEYETYVTLRTRHLRVHAAQRIRSAVVIEFRDAAYRLPARGRVAVFAGNPYRAMRVSSRSGISLFRAGHRGDDRNTEEQDNEQEQESHGPSTYAKDSSDSRRISVT